MRVLVVTGIFPPDIGGPATHAADVSAELTDRGHDVTVLTLTDAHRTARHDNVVRFPRSWAWPLRSALDAPVGGAERAALRCRLCHRARSGGGRGCTTFAPPGDPEDRG